MNITGNIKSIFVFLDNFSGENCVWSRFLVLSRSAYIHPKVFQSITFSTWRVNQLHLNLLFWMSFPFAQASWFLKKRCSENMQRIYRITPMAKCDFNKNSLQFHWNHTSAWVLSYKPAVYFQNTFSEEHLCMAASEG